MDPSWADSFLSGGATGVVLSIVYITYKLCKRSACRSSCCGAVSSFQLDLEEGLLRSPYRTVTPDKGRSPAAAASVAPATTPA